MSSLRRGALVAAAALVTGIGIVSATPAFAGTKDGFEATQDASLVAKVNIELGRDLDAPLCEAKVPSVLTLPDGVKVLLCVGADVDASGVVVAG